jgi:two-component system chemotaxis response regulator CheY
VKLLVVDDDPDSRRLLAISLGWAGHQVVEANDGEEGWDVFQREHTRLVITDWMMPGLDGMGLIRRIRLSDTEDYTYIIMLTALREKPQVVSGLEAGADDYLTKPFDPDVLSARVSIGERILKLQESLVDSRRNMERLAMHDALTGLLNRRAIHDRALAELNRLRRGTPESPLSVILLDIDHFKLINDSHGHQTGDQALQALAELLNHHLRSYDVLGRWGGEEFLILLPGTSLAEAGAVAERIRAHLSEAWLPLPDGLTVNLTASLGVAVIDDAGAGAAGQSWLDQLVSAADQALYQAKSQGRNRVVIAAAPAALPPAPPVAAPVVEGEHT